MNCAELSIIVIMRVMAITGLLAIPAIFMPYSWMNACHQMMGLGQLPEAPIVSYLARSLSGFYALLSALMLVISFDIRSYHALVKCLALLLTVAGCVLLYIDLISGMPILWTWSEGPPILVIGLLLLWLQRSIKQIE